MVREGLSEEVRSPEACEEAEGHSGQQEQWVQRPWGRSVCVLLEEQEEGHCGWSEVSRARWRTACEASSEG